MLSQREQNEIDRGIGEIFHNLHYVPIDDVAHFLVKFDPQLADKLAAALEFQFLDKGYKNVK